MFVSESSGDMAYIEETPRLVEEYSAQYQAQMELSKGSKEQKADKMVKAVYVFHILVSPALAPLKIL
jgi:hypothetical protein